MLPAFTLKFFSAGHPIALDAGGANIEAFRGAIHHGADALDVRIPTPVGAPVRVGHALAESGAFTANITGGSHNSSFCKPILSKLATCPD